MILRVLRRIYSERSTIGDLQELDETGAFARWHCFTLEDRVRPAGSPKVHGRTAIPAGRYRLSITSSPRFGAPMPLLHDVPGYSGVRMHPGNTDEDTDGCILVGYDVETDRITRSRPAYAQLFGALAMAEARGEESWIEVVDGEDAPRAESAS